MTLSFSVKQKEKKTKKLLKPLILSRSTEEYFLLPNPVPEFGGEGLCSISRYGLDMDREELAIGNLNLSSGSAQRRSCTKMKDYTTRAKNGVSLE